MTFLYAIVLGWLYKKTSKKDPIKNLLTRGKGGAGPPGAAGTTSGGGKGGGGKKIALKIWNSIRVLMLFSVILLILASPSVWPLTWFSNQPTIGEVFGIPVIGILNWITDDVFHAPFDGAAVATTGLAIAVGILLIDFLCDFELNKKARNALLIMPLLAVISIGPIAAFMNTVNGHIREGATRSVSWIWGDTGDEAHE